MTQTANRAAKCRSDFRSRFSLKTGVKKFQFFAKKLAQPWTLFGYMPFLGFIFLPLCTLYPQCELANFYIKYRPNIRPNPAEYSVSADTNFGRIGRSVILIKVQQIFTLMGNDFSDRYDKNLCTPKELSFHLLMVQNHQILDKLIVK